jgi:cobalt/nickel transport system permease protein
MFAAIAFVVAIVIAPPSPILYAIAAFLLILLTAASTIPGSFILKRLLLLEPFVICVALLMLFRPGGLPAFFTVVSRTTLCILALILMANTTPFSEILLVLRRARVPSLMITTLALMHRYLFVLRDEALRMRRARASRTFTPRHAAWHTLSSVISELFIRAVERSERIYAAMCSRGWR